MKQIQRGRWAIDAITIDSLTVMNFEGFEYLKVEADRISIHPIGFQFAVTDSTSNSAILTSSGNVFFVDFKVENNNQLKMKMTRSNFSEFFEVTARLQDSLVSVN